MFIGGAVLFSSADAQDRLQRKLNYIQPARYYKGNLHTHSLWSDGDQFPEMIADWYANRDYHFLALTDHNLLSEGERWMKLKKIVARSDDGVLDRYRERFGDSWVQTRGVGEQEVRLKPLSEFRSLVEKRGEFLLIPAEEISDKFGKKPIHINATNLAEKIEPQHGDSVRETIQNNLRAIVQHGHQHGREVLPHLNHPNFGYAVTAEDVASISAERFFEVYNGHPGVNHLGDEKHVSIETMWDQINAIRRTDLKIPPIMGIATDDSHEYHGKPGSRPGRGWVMVRSEFLTPEHLIQAMKRGDFYASSGVSLDDVNYDTQTKTLQIEIIPDGDATFTTQFIGTTRHVESSEGQREDDAHVHIGAVLSTVKGTSASYQLTGEELYVRATITSSKPHHDPSFDDQKQQAWTQPVGWE
jgi:predicted metal-dependent phosphoesterase TrpH